MGIVSGRGVGMACFAGTLHGVYKKWLNNLKLRLSYGITGNSGGMGAYSSQTGAATYSPVSIDGELSSVSQLVSPYGNPSIGWEKTYQWNYGVDLGFFDGRINLSFDYYDSKTKDLLFSRTLPVTSAITAWGSPMATWQNIGETSNKGYEIQLSTVNVKSRNFQWSSSISYTHNDEKIVDLPDGDLIAKSYSKDIPSRHSTILNMPEYGALPKKKKRRNMDANRDM